METKYIATYKQVGHPQFQEDTWSVSRKITNEKELYNWMKELCKSSARSFSGYPFGGLYAHRLITFEKQNEVLIDGEIFKGKKVKCDKPDFFDAAAARFDEWYDFLEKRLPKLIKANERRIEEERELELLHTLERKYYRTW